MSVNRTQGFTLIEVLVATLVLTVGILGVAAMQVVSFQTNQSAYARSQAVYLAQDIFDRIRANPDGYDTTGVYDDVDTENDTTIPASPTCVSSLNGCSPLQLAQHDVREWAQSFNNVDDLDEYQPALPNGRGVIARDAGTNIFTATISWDERDWDTEGSLQRKVISRSVTLVALMN